MKNLNPEEHTATILVLEAIAICMFHAGASKEEAVQTAAHLFGSAVREMELFKLEQALGDVEE